MEYKSLLLFILTTTVGAVASQGFECTSHPNNPNIVEYIINADSRLGRINTIFAQQDVNAKVPVATTTLFNWLNNEHNVTRIDSFRRYPCSEVGQSDCSRTFRMTPEQAEYSGWTSFDRGHLTPSYPFTFSADANNGTFYCVNIVPQDPYTNREPWNDLEQAVLSYFTERAGYVLTGTCGQENIFSPTLDGYKVPDCLWKLVCYKDHENVTQVVGFIGNNTLLNVNDSLGKEARRTDTLSPKSQQDVINTLNINHLPLLMEAYQKGEDYLLENRGETRAPKAEECQAVRLLPQDVREEWNCLVDTTCSGKNAGMCSYRLSFISVLICCFIGLVI